MYGKLKRSDPLTSLLGSILGGHGTSSDNTGPPTLLPLPLPSTRLPLPLPLPTSPHSSSSPSESQPDDPTSSDPTSSTALSSTAVSNSTSSSSLSTSLPTSSSVQSTPTSQPASSTKPSASVITSTSDGLIITVTVVAPAGSLAPTPHLSKGFLQNKAEVGVVFTIVALAALALFGFLGYRFFKTVKKRQQRMLEDEAARDSARYRTRIDDEDEDNDADNFSRRDMVGQAPTLPQLHVFTGAGIGTGTGDDDAPSPSHATSTSHEMAQRSPFSMERHRSMRSDAYSLAESRQSTDTQTLLLSSASGMRRSNTVRTSSSATHHRSPSSSTFPHSKSYYLSTDPFPPPLELPDTFGEDTSTRSRASSQTKASAVEDDQDYHAMMGRVLKITNE